MEVTPDCLIPRPETELLVQQGVFDVMRGRALTFVMSATFALAGVGNGVGGLFVHRVGPRWIWGAAGGVLLVAALAGSVLARHQGDEIASEAELAATEAAHATWRGVRQGRNPEVQNPPLDDATVDEPGVDLGACDDANVIGSAGSRQRECRPASDRPTEQLCRFVQRKPAVEVGADLPVTDCRKGLERGRVTTPQERLHLPLSQGIVIPITTAL